MRQGSLLALGCCLGTLIVVILTCRASLRYAHQQQIEIRCLIIFAFDGNACRTYQNDLPISSQVTVALLPILRRIV